MTREEAREILESDLENEIFERTEYRTKLLEAKKMAIEALSEPTKTEPTTITENMTNGDVLNKIFPVIAERARDNEYYLDKDKDNLTYIHIDGDWISKPYKGNFTTPTRPKAKWIMTGENEELYCEMARCSFCGGLTINNGGDKFCPDCGAEMESE